MLSFEQVNTLELREYFRRITVLALQAGVSSSLLEDMLGNLQEFEQAAIRRDYEN